MSGACTTWTKAWKDAACVLVCVLWVSACASTLPPGGTGTGPATDAAQTDAHADATGATADAPDVGTVFDPQPGATAVTPDVGPTSGLQVVVITGESLAGVQQVFFGDSPALQVDVIDDMTLQVVTPPRPVGVVDVTLHVPTPAGQTPVPDQVIAEGYRYQGSVALHSVSPAHGPASGGTPVTVQGDGLTPQTQFVVGHRQAVLPSVIDEHTATFLTPPGSGGTVSVTAVNPDGSAELKHAFTYHEAPVLTGAAPAVQPWSAAGGQTLTLTGHGLTGLAMQVTLHSSQADVTAQVLHTDGATLVVRLGTVAAPGVFDVTVTHGDGTATLAGAVALVQPVAKPEQMPWALLTVSPAQQPVNALAPVAIGVTGYAPASTWQAEQKQPTALVTFAGVVAKVLAVEPTPDGTGATLRVQPPMPLDPTQVPQPVTVGVEWLKHAVQKPQAFTYTAPVPKLVAVTPSTLDPAGGPELTLTWTPRLAGSPSVVGVRVGALQASHVTADSAAKPGEGTLHAVAPAGSPGWADVTLQFADGTTATAPQAVEYVGASRQLVAILPATGAQAGGTQVEIVGQGLGGMQSLWIGGKQATQLQIHDNGWATAITPRGNPGPVDVMGKWPVNGPLPASQSTLPQAFVYFDPISTVGGTWGDALDGALNVTVVQKSDSQTPIPGALVYVQTPLATFQGLTDDRGQVTLSGPGMVPPVHVHASKEQYTAGSLIALSTENATIRLLKPSPGKPNTDPVPPNGTVTGTVLDADKYTVLPPGSCAGEAVVGGNCAPCTADKDCATGASCELIGLSDATTITDGGYCAAPCTGMADCPDGWTCSQLGTGLDARARCVPTVGKPQIRCQAAGGSIFGGGTQPNDGIVGPDLHFSLSVTPGPTAALCWSGYVDKHTGLFVPVALGVTRHLFTIPGQQVGGVEVHVRVPLDRELRVHMLALPVGPDTTGGQRSLTAGVDLGSDGYIPLGTLTTTQVTDTLTLGRQPNASLFAAPNDDLRYEFYGGLASAYGGTPQSTAAAPGRAVTGLDRAAVWAPGTDAPVVAKLGPGAMHALAAAGETRVGVGDGGRIATWTGGDFTTQASPTSKTLRAVWLAPDTLPTPGLDGWAAGDDGVLVRRSALGWTQWPTGLGESVVALDGRTSGDVWALSRSGVLHRWTTQPGQAPAWQSAGDVPPLGAGLQFRALLLLPNDQLLAAGDQGQLWLAQPAGLPGTWSWLSVPTGTTANLNALALDTDGTVWLAGDRGYVGVWNGITTTPVKSGTTRNLYGLRIDGGDVHVVGGQGTWLRIAQNGKVTDRSVAETPVDFRGVLPTFDGGLVAAGEPVIEMGPYLEMPYLTLPTPGGALGSRLEWMAAPGHTPTLNLLRLADNTYTTRWEIFLHGSVTSVDLPDFVALGKFNPLPTGMLYVRHWRILAPQLDIDHLNPKLLNQYTWTSWAYTTSPVVSPTPSPGPFNPTLPPPEPPSAWPFPK